MNSKLTLAAVALVIIGGFFFYMFSTDLPSPGGRSERGDEVVEINSLFDNISADKNVKSGTGLIKGIFVASAASTPQLKIYDSNVHRTGETILVNAFTPVAATMYDFGSGVEFTTGLFVVVSGTVDATVFYK